MSGRCSTARESWETAIDGTVEFACEALETAAERRDVLDAVAARLLGAHQLQVVDDEQLQPAVAHRDLAGVRAQRGEGEVAVVEQVKRKTDARLRGFQQRRPVVFVQAPEVDAARCDA